MTADSLKRHCRYCWMRDLHIGLFGRIEMQRGSNKIGGRAHRSRSWSVIDSLVAAVAHLCARDSSELHAYNGRPPYHQIDPDRIYSEHCLEAHHARAYGFIKRMALSVPFSTYFWHRLCLLRSSFFLLALSLLLYFGRGGGERERERVEVFRCEKERRWIL